MSVNKTIMTKIFVIYNSLKNNKTFNKLLILLDKIYNNSPLILNKFFINMWLRRF